MERDFAARAIGGGVVPDAQAGEVSLDNEAFQLTYLLAGWKLRSWDQSALRYHAPRSSIAGGLAEKIANIFSEQDGATLGWLLTHSGQPSSNTNNPYIGLTKNIAGGTSKEFALLRAIGAPSWRLNSVTPSGVLNRALRVCDGDYWLAMLTAHNMLKEITYAHRHGRKAILGWSGANPDDVSKWKTASSTQAVVDLFVNIRPKGDPHYSDKMGPIYHMFGLFFVGSIMTGSEADFLAWGENLTRALGLGSSGDAFKEKVNDWASDLCFTLNRMAETDYYLVTTHSLGDLKRFNQKARDHHRRLQAQIEKYRPLAASINSGATAEFIMDSCRLRQRVFAKYIQITAEKIKQKQAAK